MRGIGWIISESGGGGDVVLAGDVTGLSSDNTVVALHSGGSQYPIGFFNEGNPLYVLGGQIVASPALSLSGDVNGPINNTVVTALHDGSDQYLINGFNEGDVLSLIGGEITSGGPIPTTLVGDANGLFGNTQVTAIHAAGTPLTFGALINNQVLSVVGGQIVAGGVMPSALSGDASGPLGATQVTAVHANGVAYSFGDLANNQVLSVIAGQIVAGGAIPTALLGDANGPLGATLVTAIHAGGTALSLTSLTDGQVLVRSGTTITSGGALPTSLSGDANGPLGNTSVTAVHASGVALTLGAIADGTALVRSGTSIIGQSLTNFPRVLFVNFAFSQTVVNIGAAILPANAVVFKIQCSITQTFNSATASLTIGWAGNVTGLMEAGETNLQVINTASHDRLITIVANNQPQIFINSAGSTQGLGLVALHYGLT